jgi:hypothetical protein
MWNATSVVISLVPTRDLKFLDLNIHKLDEPIYDYIVQNATASAEQKKYPIWKLIYGAEGEKLPFGEKISTYSMSKNDFKAISN